MSLVDSNEHRIITSLCICPSALQILLAQGSALWFLQPATTLWSTSFPGAAPAPAAAGSCYQRKSFDNSHRTLPAQQHAGREQLANMAAEPELSSGWTTRTLQSDWHSIHRHECEWTLMTKWSTTSGDNINVTGLCWFLFRPKVATKH